jgi:hypothetical protein
MTKLALLLLSIVTFAGSAEVVFAQNCKPLYGGGVTKEQACEGEKLIAPTGNTPAKATPTPKKALPTQAKKPTQKPGTTTKGGLPVLSPTPQKATPSTGPEILGIIALAPAAALGFYLRKKG